MEVAEVRPPGLYAVWSSRKAVTSDSRNLQPDHLADDLEVDHRGHERRRPTDIGSVVQPGQFADFEVQYRWLSDQNDGITYSNSDGTFNASLEVDGFTPGAPSSKCTSARAAMCAPIPMTWSTEPTARSSRT